MNEISNQIRLNKYLSDCGICSRRQADSLIEAGKVTVDGKVAPLGMKILPSQKIICDGILVKKRQETVIIALNKPVGIECTTSKDIKNNIVDFVNYPTRIYPIGRLDKNSEGLILLTNDGSLVNNILKASNYHEKEYQVRVNKKIDSEFIKNMSKGVPILDTITRPCKVKKIDDYTFNIILTQGLNRQIRRMCDYLGFKVVSLKRIRIMDLRLGNLKTGKYRELSKKEAEELRVK